MPNHFHLMVYVHDLEIEVGGSAEIGNDEIGSTTLSRATNTNTNTDTDRTRAAKIQTLNKSIAILLTSYTRAINIQENRSGSLFKPHTKAECLTKANGSTPSFYGSRINVRIPEKEYPQVCFNYIHQNPVNANLVKLPEEWEFSSYPDYCGIRNGKLINRARAVEFELVFSY